MLAGRDFTERDNESTMQVAIVNEAFAQRFFGGGNPIGRKVRSWGKWHTVVGVVKNVRYHNLSNAAEPYFYAPFRQRFSTGLTTVFYVRTIGDPAAASTLLRRAAASIDPSAEVLEAMPLGVYIGQSLYPLKVAAALLAVLGGLAVVLAALGLYSVMAYAVTQRTHEVGIRMALGAQPGSVLGMVVRQGLALTAVGLAAGTAAALAITRLVGGLLVGVQSADPATFAAATAFLIAVAALASYLPARRATRVDPMVALRWE
jgi:predicted permease